MPLASQAAPYTIQRQAEDVSALLGDLHDRDGEQAAALRELARYLAYSLPAREIVHRERRILAELAAHQQRDERDVGEALPLSRDLAGTAGNLAREICGNEKAAHPLSTDERPRTTTDPNDTTGPRQLALDWSDL